MEPEGSWPYTQEPATCPYPEPDQSSLRPHTQPLEDPFGSERHPGCLCTTSRNIHHSKRLNLKKILAYRTHKNDGTECSCICHKTWERYLLFMQMLVAGWYLNRVTNH
jgi:hypothetical protein